MIKAVKDHLSSKTKQIFMENGIVLQDTMYCTKILVFHIQSRGSPVIMPHYEGSAYRLLPGQSREVGGLVR